MEDAPITSTPPPVPEQTGLKLRLRISIWLGIAAASILGALIYREPWLARPIGEGPAGPNLIAQPFEKTWSERHVVLLGLGDSITDGYGASPGHSYFQRLSTSLKDDPERLRNCQLKSVLPNLEARNDSLSGTTSIELLEYSLPRQEVQPPDVYGIVVITTGGNDVIHHYGRTPPREGAMYGATFDEAQPWIANFEVRLGEIIARVEALFPGGCTIFLANIYDPTDDIGDAENAGLPKWPDGKRILNAYNDVIARVATTSSHVELIDIHAEFLGHGIHCRQFWTQHYHSEDPNYWYFDNLEDPNDRGYDAIRRLFLNRMGEVLPERFARMSESVATDSVQEIGEVQ